MSDYRTIGPLVIFCFTDFFLQQEDEIKIKTKFIRTILIKLENGPNEFKIVLPSILI